MGNFGPIHKLFVRDVGEPYGPLDTGEFADYEIVHPAECKSVDDEMYGGKRWTCGVGYQESEGSLRWSLKYTGTPINEPGEYTIQAWAEKYSGFDYTEYDGGVALCDEVGEPAA